MFQMRAWTRGIIAGIVTWGVMVLMMGRCSCDVASADPHSALPAPSISLDRALELPQHVLQ